MNVLIRPFSNADYKVPKLTKDLHLLTTEWNKDLFVEKDGKILKQMDSIQLDTLADEVIERARELWKKVVYIASKNTISKFDAAFVNYLKAKFEVEWLEVQDPLFDSFLPTLINGQYSWEIVVCPPDQAKMLDWYDGLSQSQIPKNVESSKIKDVVVFRVATGSGYGEKFSEEVTKRDVPTAERVRTIKNISVLSESYTFNKRDVEVSAQRAFEEANERWAKLILVTASSENNVVDSTFIRIVSDTIWKENFEVKSISDVMKDKLMNPSNNDTVFLTANNVWDYITDFFPQFFYGKLGKAALGVGYEIAEWVDKNGDVVVRQFAPSTGTAPDITKKSDINPAGMLLAVSDSILYDENAPKNLIEVVNTMKKNVFLTLGEVENGNYKWFWEKVLEKTFWVDSVEDKTKEA